MDNTSNKMIVVLVMSVATICAFLLVLLGTYYAPVSANVYISNLPNASQFDQLKNNSIFKVTGLQEEDQYMCPKVYIIRTTTSRTAMHTAMAMASTFTRNHTTIL